MDWPITKRIPPSFRARPDLSTGIKMSETGSSCFRTFVHGPLDISPLVSCMLLACFYLAPFFLDITTLVEVNVTACNRENSFIFDNDT